MKNIDLVLKICDILQTLSNDNFDYSRLIDFVKDRPGHDFRYAIDTSKLKKDLDWYPTKDFETNLKNTVKWYLDNSQWYMGIFSKSNFKGERIGLIKS